MSIEVISKIRCNKCSGTGTVNRSIYLEDLDAYIKPHLVGDHRNKINAIKEARREWDIALVDAKNVVEAYIDYLDMMAMDTPLQAMQKRIANLYDTSSKPVFGEE